MRQPFGHAEVAGVVERGFRSEGHAELVVLLDLRVLVIDVQAGSTPSVMTRVRNRPGVARFPLRMILRPKISDTRSRRSASRLPRMISSKSLPADRGSFTKLSPSKHRSPGWGEALLALHPQDPAIRCVRYQVVPHEAVLVSEMFRRYADEGAAIADLRRWLTDRGVRAHTGKERWDRSVHLPRTSCLACREPLQQARHPRCPSALAAAVSSSRAGFGRC